MRISIRQIPNALSFSRIPIAAIFLVTFDTASVTLFWASMIWLAVALVTDFLDGYIARAYNIATRSGYFIDGVGDKAVYIAILLVIFREDQNHKLLPWLLIAREVILYALRAIEGGSVAVLETVRPISLTYALFIRLYFLMFFAGTALQLYGQRPVGFFDYYSTFGYLAAICGYLHIGWLAKLMAKPA
jgi:phosphatidylglycerophosphate synthase